MIEQGYSGCESQRFNGWRVSASSLSHVRIGAAGARVRGTELKSGHEQINSVRSQVQRSESEKAYFPTTGKAGDGHPNITRNPICDRVRERCKIRGDHAALNAFFFLLQDPSLKKLSSDRGSAYFSVADLISALEIIASPEHIPYRSLVFCVGRMLERCHIGPYISSVCLARSICREFGSDMASLPVVEQCLRTRGAR